MRSSCMQRNRSLSSKRIFLVTIFACSLVIILATTTIRIPILQVVDFPTQNVYFSLKTRNEVLDVAKVEAFNSHCNVTKLTFFPSRGLGGNDTTGARRASHVDDVISTFQPFIAKHPTGSRYNCPRTLQMADFPIPITALLSFPGSGNTWSRHLIEQLTGVHSGSVYFLTTLKKQGVFPCEGATANVSVVKTHIAPDASGVLSYMQKNHEEELRKIVTFDKVILLIRNPYAAMMAEFKRAVMHLGHKRNRAIDPHSTKWHTFVEKGSKKWGRFLVRSLKVALPHLVLFYEDMTSSLFPELVRIAAFLRTNNLSEFSLCCVMKGDSEGDVHRSSINQTVFDVFNPVQRSVVNRVVTEAANIIQIYKPDIAKRILEYILL